MVKLWYKKVYFLLLGLILIQQSASAEEVVLKEFGTGKTVLKNTLKSENIVYPGRIPLNDIGAYIYSVVDPVPREGKLAVGTRGLEGIEEEEIEFYLYSNYQEKISRWEIYIYSGDEIGRGNPLEIIEGTGIDVDKAVVWKIPKEFSKEIGEEIQYCLRVYDENGNFDETGMKKVDKNRIYGMDETKIRNIPISGARVRVYGKGIENCEKIAVGDQEIELDSKGDFIYEFYSDSYGKREMDIVVHELDGKKQSYRMRIEIPKEYNFLVGMADFSLGKSYTSGNDEILKSDFRYDGDLFTSGRLAFYYKGVKNGYRITAQGDTWENEIKDMFKNFSKKNNRDLYEKLDREDIEFNLGDESTYYRDTNTPGKFYLRVDKDKSYGVWGSYDTGINGNYYLDYNRSLYGFKGEYRSLDATSFGDSVYEAMGFAAEPDTLFTSDEFLGTGGSVYFLSFDDIVTGSAKLRIEIRDSRTGRVEREIPLAEYQDYEINELQGRIILTNPLPTLISNSGIGSIIKEEPFDGKEIVLVADYEFYSRDTDFSKSTYGAKGKVWLNDNVALGGTIISENRGKELDNYELQGLDVTFRKSENSYLKLEIARSEGAQNIVNNFSYNGGFNSSYGRDEYEKFLTGELRGKYNNIDGSAYYLEGETYLKDWNEKFDSKDRLGFWYRKKESGFSKSSLKNDANVDDYGFKAEYMLDEKWELSGGANYFKEKNENLIIDGDMDKLEETRANIQLGYQYSEKLKLSGELEYLKNREYTYLENEDEEALMLGARAEYEFQPEKKVYTEVQTAVLDDGYGANNIFTVGTDLRIGEKLQLNAEGSAGNRGQGVQVLGGYDLDPTHNIYVGYALENDTSAFGDGNENIFTVGQKYRYDKDTKLYHENQFMRDSKGNGILQTYGIDREYSKDLQVGMLIQSGEIDTESGKLKRKSTSAYSRYYGKDFMIRNKLEYGRDKGAGISGNTWATINRAKKILNTEYTLFGELNYVYRDSKDERDDRSAEAGLGLAYRPVWNDRLNFIGTYSYIYNLGIDSQLNYTGDEKAHVMSLEAVYQLSQKWDIGGKYAIRFEDTKPENGAGDWSKSKIDLYAVRVNYEFIKRWYAFGEYHILRDIDEDSLEHGAILALYREVGENLKMGVGYNFTDFNDDLTNSDYDSKGWFINVIGKF